MTTAFDPGLGSIGAFAFGRCGVRRPAIDRNHLEDMAMAANLVLADWSADEPMLWQVQLRTVPLVQAVTEYTLPTDVLLVLDCFVRVNYGTLYELDGFGNIVRDGFNQPIVITQGSPETVVDRVLYGVSRSEYASYPNKSHQAPPTVYWADRVHPVQVSIYPTPDGKRVYEFNYFSIIQDQDQALTGDLATGLPYRMMSVFADALAAKLALSYAPERFDMLDKVAERSYTRARTGENENVPIFIQPNLFGYFH